MEGGWRHSGLPEDEEDIWEYVREEALGDGEHPILGETGFDRVIWPRGTPINMVRVRLALERIMRGREEQSVIEANNFWAEDQSLLVVDEDGIRVISNVNRVLMNNETGILGTFVDDIIVERRHGGIVGREEEIGEEARRDLGGNGGRERRNGRVVIYPTPIEVVGVSGSRCNLFDAGGMSFSGLKVDAMVREREEFSIERGGVSTNSSSSSEEDDSGAEYDMPSGGEN